MAFAVTEGFYSRYFFKVQTNVETCHPRNPPGLASPNHPHNGQGGFGRPPIPGVGGAVTNRRKPPCGIVSGHCPQGSLVKGSWHGEAVTEGFYSRHFFKVQTYVKRGRFFRE